MPQNNKINWAGINSPLIAYMQENDPKAAEMLKQALQDILGDLRNFQYNQAELDMYDWHSSKSEDMNVIGQT